MLLLFNLINHKVKKITFVQVLFYFLSGSLLFSASSCVTVEKLVYRNRLSEAEVFCANKKGKTQNTCYCTLATAYFRRGNFEKAFLTYQTAGMEKEGGLKVANTLFKSGRYEEAYAYYQKAGEESMGAFMIADTLLMNNEYVKAFDYYQKAGKRELGGRKIGAVFVTQKDYKQALEWYTLVNHAKEAYGVIGQGLFNDRWYRLAYDCFIKQGNPDSATVCKNKVIEGLTNMEDGKIFSNNLPENRAVLLTSHSILSNTENYQLKLSNLFTEDNLKFSTQPTIFKSFAATDFGWDALAALGDSAVDVDLFTGVALKTYTGHTSVVTEILLLPGSDKFLTASWDGSVKCWDAKSGLCLNTYTGHYKPVTSIAAGENASLFASGSWDETIIIWDIATGKIIRKLFNTSPVTDIVMSADEKYVVSCSKNNTIKIFDIQKGVVYKTLEGHSNYIQDIALSKDGNYLISGDFDGITKIWDFKSGKLLKSFRAHETSVTAIGIAPNSKYFVTCGIDHNMKFWWLTEKNKALKEIENEGL